MADRLSDLYHDLLDGTYDCVDRIVLNAYFRPGHNPGGFRVWWRRLTGSDATLDTVHLMRRAGRFSRRVRAYAKANRIPVIDCGVNERKHEIAEKQLATTTVTEGVFLILVGKAQAPVWDVSGKHHLERERPMPYVNHYAILERFVDVLACIDRCFVGGEMLDALPLPSQLGHTKVAGIDLNKPRMQWVAAAVLAVAITPRGFTVSDVARQVQRLGGSAASTYTPRRAAYDLKKLRGKDFVRRIDGTRRYEALPSGLKTLATATVLRTQVIKPLLAAVVDTAPVREPHNPTALDRHYDSGLACTASFTNSESRHDRQFPAHQVPVRA